MQSLLVFSAVLVAGSAQIYLTPDHIRYSHESGSALQRHARDVTVDPRTGKVSGQYPVGGGNVFGTVQGSEGRFGYERNIFDNEHGKLDGSAYHGRTLGGPGADASSLGGRLDWTGDRGAGSLDVNRLNHGATSVNAAGGGTWPLGRNFDASVQGTYSQTLGHGRPDVGVLGTINGRW